MGEGCGEEEDDEQHKRTWSLRVVLSVLMASGAATALTATTRREADDARTTRALFWSCIIAGAGAESRVMSLFSLLERLSIRETRV
jgi:hypothetical protein